MSSDSCGYKVETDLRPPVWPWNSAALWSQISCPLHLLIQEHWFLRRFNLLSGVWLVMILLRPLCSQKKTWKQSFWCIIYFLSLPFHVWTLKFHGLRPHAPEKRMLCPLVISGNWRNMFSTHHRKSRSRGHQLQRLSHEKTGWQVSTVDSSTGLKMFDKGWFFFLSPVDAYILIISW